MRKMMSQSRNNEYIIRSNNMVRKTVAKKIAKTIKPKPKPKAPKVRRAQGNQPPGRVGTTQNPASKSVTKTTPKKTTTPKSTGFSTKPQATGTRSLKGTPTEKITLPRLAGAAAAGMAVGTGALISAKNKGGSFDDAFRKARAKGEGTNFTHNGKKYTAVTKDDLKKKGYSSLAAYNKAGGAKKVDASKAAKKVVSEVNKNKKRKRPVINAVKRVLLGKDKKFGGDKGLIDFIRKPKKKADGGMMNSSKPRRSSSRRGVGAAKRGFGKALR